MIETELSFVEMPQREQAPVQALISRSMGSGEAEHAKNTFDFHFKCDEFDPDHSFNMQMDTSINSGRCFYVVKHNTNIIAVTGLHQYRWGPDENVWLSWFAVEPKWQSQGVGAWALQQTEAMAKQRGYKKLFIETYSRDTFSRARYFYQKRGFLPVGHITDYLTDGSDMLVFCKRLGIDTN